MVISAGTRLGPYVVEAPLGAGGMGVVYAAEDSRLGRRVALKFLPLEHASDPQAVERFLREARAASALGHAHICTIYDIGTADSDDGPQHFIVMELLEGQTLKHLVDGTPVPVETAVTLGTHIAEALGAAHAKGIIHRDIKPANVFVTQDGNAKVLDFGVAKFDVAASGGGRPSGLSEAATISREPLTGPGVALGTIDYMSPEQVRGEDVDARTDIFSLGLVLYEMVTGQPAFSGKTSAMVFDAILHSTPIAPVRLNPAVPAELEHIIMRALEKDRRLRYQTAPDLASDLRRVARLVESGSTGDADGLPAPARAQKRKRSGRARGTTPRRGSATAKGATPASGSRPRVPRAPSGAADHAAAGVSGADRAGDSASISAWWRNRRVVVTGSAVLLVAGVIAAGLLIGNRTAAQAGIGASGRPAVAVMAFDNPGGVQDAVWLTTALPGMLVTGLGQTPGVDVVGRQRVEEILTSLGGGDGKPVEASQVLDVGRRSGAGAMVVGNVFKAGSDFRIDVQVEDVATGRLLGAHTVRGADVFALADDLTARILGSLSLTPATGIRRIADLSSGSTEAYRLYTDGLRASRLLRKDDARKLFEAAVEADPSFAAAWLELSEVAGALDDRASQERYRERVREHIDRLTARQRQEFEASQSVRDGRTADAVDILEQLIAQYPDEEQAYGLLSSNYRQAGDLTKSVEVIERGVKALPQAGGLHNAYGYALIAAGRYREALREFETYARLEPNEPNPYDSQAEVYVIMSQPEQALGRYARVLEIDPTFVNGHFGRAWAFGMMGRFDEALAEAMIAETALAMPGSSTNDANALTGLLLTRAGRYREAAVQWRRGRAASVKVNNTIDLPVFDLLEGLSDIERGNSAAALQAAKRMVAGVDALVAAVAGQRQDWRVLSILLSGMATLRAGQRDDARGWLEQMKSTVRPQLEWHMWALHTLEGEIGLAYGDVAAAERAFTSAEPALKMWFNMGTPSTSLSRNNFPFRDGLARALAARGDVDGAIGQYQRLLTLDLSQKWTAFMEPRLVLQLARLYDRKGDRAAARREYQRFLELWARADAGLPEVAEARQKAR